MLVYSILINYILFMSLKILLTNSSLKKKRRYNQMIIGIVFILFLFFSQLNNNIKNYFCIYLIIVETRLIWTTIKTSFIKPRKIFYKDFQNKKEEFFLIDFSLKKTLGMLFLYFTIDLLFIYKNFIPFNELITIKIILFNPILEGISLSIFASCVFLIMQQINTFKNNFLIYQKLMHSLKNIFHIINDLEFTEYLVTSEMHKINLKKCNFYRTDFLKKQLDYLDNSKTFYLNRLDQSNIKLIISEINKDDANNIDISERILSLLDSMNDLKKNPIKYIISNY